MKLVCIGGGNGASQVMVGMKQHASITGVIAVTDSGRSTGKIRVAANIPAPGDIRNALLALSEADEDVKKLFQFRFRSEKMTDLDGMAFGNLFIAAFAQMHGNFEKAVAETATFLKVRGRILPVTLYNTHLCAELEDGSIVCEELNVRALNKPSIKRLFFKDQGVRVNPEAAAAIRDADKVTIGPGSLFTTVIACLLAEGMVEALKACQGRVVYIANTTTQPGQTDGLTLMDHVRTLVEYLGKGVLSIVLVNTKAPSEKELDRIQKEGLTFLHPSDSECRSIEKEFDVSVIGADLIEKAGRDANLWNKVSTIRHDPEKIAKAMLA